MAAPESGPPVVFLGPTLPTEDAARILPATYLAPASQGSIVLAVRRFRPSSILLVDGLFEGVPAVRHKEILWALAQGVPILGASSMGALRAAELHGQGMIGVGRIYRWYRRFPLLPDDAVAVHQGPPELGSAPLTRALVDVKLTTRRAERAGVLDRAARDRLDKAAMALNFRDRTLTRIVDRAFAAGSAEDKTSLRNRLVDLYVAQKREDACRALRLLARGRPSGPAGSSFTMTGVYLHDMRAAGIDLP